MSKGTGTHLLTETERYILDTLQELHYGTVEVVVHDSRIVQVEVSTRHRFDKPGGSQHSAGRNVARADRGLP